VCVSGVRFAIRALKIGGAEKNFPCAVRIANKKYEREKCAVILENNQKTSWPKTL